GQLPFLALLLPSRRGIPEADMAHGTDDGRRSFAVRAEYRVAEDSPRALQLQREDRVLRIRVPLPDPGAFVLTPGGHQELTPTPRTGGQPQRRVLVGRDRSTQSTGVRVPHADGPVMVSAGGGPAVPAEGHPIDRAGLGAEGRIDLASRVRVPNPDGPVPTGSGDPPTVRGERHAGHGGVTRGQPLFSARPGVPHPDGPARTRRG